MKFPSCNNSLDMLLNANIPVLACPFCKSDLDWDSLTLTLKNVRCRLEVLNVFNIPVALAKALSLNASAQKNNIEECVATLGYDHHNFYPVRLIKD